MKILSTALLAAGLLALGACGGADDDAANNVGADTLNVAPDDLGTDNLIVDEGNDLLLDDSSLNEAENAAETNAVGNTL